MSAYPWLTQTEDGWEADLQGCTMVEADRRLVIIQELTSGRLQLVEGPAVPVATTIAVRAPMSASSARRGCNAS